MALPPQMSRQDLAAPNSVVVSPLVGVTVIPAVALVLAIGCFAALVYYNVVMFGVFAAIMLGSFAVFRIFGPDEAPDPA